MPKDQAMDFVAAEYSRGLVKERPPRDPADIAAQASQLLDDFLDREKIERHTVPSETRPLLMLLAEGVHLYPEELETISEYVRSRQEHIQGGTLIKLWHLKGLGLVLMAPYLFFLFFFFWGHTFPVYCGSFLNFYFFQPPTLRGRGVACYLQGWGNHLLCSLLHLGPLNPSLLLELGGP